MDDSVIWLQAFSEEYIKIAAESTGRDEGAPKPKSDVYHDVAKKFPQLAEKKAGALGALGGGLRRAGEQLDKHPHAVELAGLGALAVPGLDTIQARLRAGPGASEHQLTKKRFLGEGAHAAADVGGLGVLAAPVIAKKLLGH